MDGSPRTRRGILSRLRSRTVNSSQRIVVGLKSDNSSREMLLRLLHSIVSPGDNVVAVHVQHSDDVVDPNTFHIHEDLCKSKQVDFEVRICTGRCYTTELSHQVRLTFASILAVGCKATSPDNSFTAKFLKALPPTCKLLIMDHGGKILFQKMGTSQQGSTSTACRTLMPSLSESCSRTDHSGTRAPVRKSCSLPSSSTTSTSQHAETRESISLKHNKQLHNLSPQLFHRLAMLGAKGHCKCFTLEELNSATQNFGPDMLIGEGAESQVFQATLENGQSAVVKVVKTSEGGIFQEMEILSDLKHENIVQIFGYCHSKELCAIVYSMVCSTLKQKLNKLLWNERMQIAIGVAQGLEYLHSCYPPIIHKAVNSTNILLSVDGKPHLANFGAAKAYLAPEYIKHCKVDEKVDVYSYGVLLLELITGREDIHVRSLLTCGQYEHLDTNLNGEYKTDEMETIIAVARLCLLHSYSRRPTMKAILQFLENPNCMSEIQTNRENLLVQKNWTQR